MWKPKDGREPREAVLASFWKPAAKGDTLIGTITSMGKTQFGLALTLSPVVLIPASGDARSYGSLNVGVNTWLSKLVNDNMKGQTIVVRYTGAQDTPQGKMRTYDVYDSSDTEFKEWIKKAVAGDGEGDGEDDDLPF